ARHQPWSAATRNLDRTGYHQRRFVVAIQLPQRRAETRRYLAELRAATLMTRRSAPASRPKPERVARQAYDRLAKIETEVERLQARRAELEARLADARFGASPRRRRRWSTSSPRYRRRSTRPRRAGNRSSPRRRPLYSPAWRARSI